MEIISGNVPAIERKSPYHYQFDHFLEAGALACFSTRVLDMGFSAPKLETNRTLFLNTFSLDPKGLVCCQQPHGAKATLIAQTDKGSGAFSFETAIPYADALVTDCRSIPLAVFTADCLPIFVFAADKKAGAVIHAGWRGTKEGIVKNTLSLMHCVFGVDARKLLVGFGPSIRRCCYEVQEEMREHFPDAIGQKNGKLYLDLIQENTSQLLVMGVAREQIIDSGLCTACRSDEFFSYRREGSSAGRMMSVFAVL